MSAPKERGILFTDAMVRAIIAGKKTQTRRTMRTNHVGYHSFARWDGAPGTRAMMRCSNDPGIATGSKELRSVFCEDNRLGAPGDRIWVREAWQAYDATAGDDIGRPMRGRLATSRVVVIYRSTHPEVEGPWRPSPLMPRWASRITLEVTGVRVERAQDISDADVDAEGVDAEAVQSLWCAATGKRKTECGPVGTIASGGDDVDTEFMTPIERWQTAWTLINGRESWDANPWVWVIEFKVVPDAR